VGQASPLSELARNRLATQGGFDVASRSLPPGPRGHFLLGHLLPYMRDPLGFFSQCARDFGDVVRLRLFNAYCYQLTHPDHIEFVLRGGHEHFVKDRFTRSSLYLMGEGMLTSEGERWRGQRRTAQPAFHSGRVATYADEIVSAAVHMSDRWEIGQVRDVYSDFAALTLEIAARTLFGADLREKGSEVSAAMGDLSRYLENPVHWTHLGRLLPSPSAFRFRKAVRLLRDLIQEIVRRRRRQSEPSDDLLGALLASKAEKDPATADKELFDEALTILLAGHETTAIVLAFCFYLLSLHSQVANRLADELERILGDRLPTAGDLPLLRYAEWVVKESMRLYPPAYQIGREAIHDCEVGGYFVPKGTVVLPTQWVVHRDARWFERPEEFLPERWTDGFQQRLPRGAYFPFGDGPRTCIGSHFAMTESVLVLATLAPRFRFEAVSAEAIPLLPSITLRPRHGIRLRVHRRTAVIPT
jgi:cytochrome P450